MLFVPRRLVRSLQIAGAIHDRARGRRYGVRIRVLGTGCGLLLSMGLGRLGRSLLYGVHQVDILWLARTAVMVTVTMCACLVPSYRAARIEPLETLRRQ